ncbi:hypothetical protein [Aquimarina algiphila]|uniref:hypothetical protein n=1 Tax=Aquimarina algiphila TaxID=2047982 RepID=UPI002493AB1E|nr:hypothetical protein [Aquimarina algiphila]
MEVFFKKTILLLCTIAFYNCGVGQNYNIKYSNIEPTEKQKKVIKEVQKDGDLVIGFDIGFEKNNVLITTNNSIKYKEILTTDHTLGLAGSYTFFRDSTKIVQVIIDDHKIELVIKKEYPFINIDLIKGVPEIEYSKVYRQYQ